MGEEAAAASQIRVKPPLAVASMLDQTVGPFPASMGLLRGTPLESTRWKKMPSPVCQARTEDPFWRVAETAIAHYPSLEIVPWPHAFFEVPYPEHRICRGLVLTRAPGRGFGSS